MISRRSFLGQTAGFTIVLASGRRVWALPSAAETYAASTSLAWFHNASAVVAGGSPRVSSGGTTSTNQLI